MKTKSDLIRLANTVGAILEEDEGMRDMRAFQLVAPSGKRWLSSDGLHLRVDWATGSTPQARAFNESAFRDAQDRITCGLEDIPAEDAHLYDEE